MKKLLFAICAMAFALNVMAQERNSVYTVKVHDLRYAVPDKKVTVGAVALGVLDALAGEATDANHKELAPSVSSALKTAFSSVRRLAPVAEEEGAQFDIQGDITSIVTHTSTRTVEHKDKNGKVTKEVVNNYEASIGLTLTLTELATGQQWTNSFSSNTNWYDYPTSELNAFELALKMLRKDIVKTYNGMFPLVATIIERASEKKDKQKEVYIDLGAANDVREDMHFDVFELRTVAGQETREKIGRLKLEQVKGDNISLCKVDKGAKEIKSALDANAPLLIISTD